MKFKICIFWGNLTEQSKHARIVMLCLHTDHVFLLSSQIMQPDVCTISVFFLAFLC